MAPTKETAEEQLLRMIEGPAAPEPPRPQGRFSPAELLQRVQRALDELRRWILPSAREGADGLLWRLRLAQRAMWGVLICMALYLVIDLALLRPTLPTLTREGGSEHPAAATGAVAIEDRLKPLPEYRETLTGRNPFGLMMHRALQDEPDESAQAKLLEITSTLRVVGINRGRVPEALIEDATANRTHIVKVGDTLNGLTVKAIDARGVLVSYEGEETLLE